MNEFGHQPARAPRHSVERLVRRFKSQHQNSSLPYVLRKCGHNAADFLHCKIKSRIPPNYHRENPLTSTNSCF
jgi:hypothetical protein